MQNQMYVYPIESGSEMMFVELFGGNENPTDADCNSSLQRAALDYVRKGGQFTACSMFILREDAKKVGTMPYGTAAQRVDAVARMQDYDRNP